MLTETTYNEVNGDKLNATFYSDFRANFDGNNKTVKLAIDRCYDSSIHTAALFNDLLDRTATATYEIKNLKMTGSVTSVVKTFNGAIETTDGNSDYPNRTAAVIGLMRKPWKLSNITVEDMTIDAKGQAGGIVAWIEPENNKNKTFEISNCEIGKNTAISSYGGSSGGIVGVMTQQADVTTNFSGVTLKLDGCKVSGTTTQPVQIEVKRRTEDKNDSSNGNYNDIQRAAGRSGGLVGYVGPRHNRTTSNAKPYVTMNVANAQVSNASIIGAYSTGGLVGEYDGVGSSTNVTGVTITGSSVGTCQIEATRGNVGTNDVYFDYGVGGLIGQMRGYSLTIGETTTNVTVSNTNIISSAASFNGSDAASLRNGMYAGGVVGCLKTTTAALTKISVTGALDGTARAALELGGQKYQIKSGKADVGGIIGRAVGTGALTMKGMTVSGMHVTAGDWGKNSENKTVFSSGNAVSGRVGGIVGTNQMTITIAGISTALESGAYVYDCMLTASENNVGGIVGAMVGYNGSSFRSTDMRNVEVKDSIIGYNNTACFNKTDAGAGGIWGKLPYTNNASNKHRLENAKISGCWIYGVSVGGVVGRSENYVQLCSNQTGSDTADGVTISNNKMYGYYVGGALGYSGSSAVNYIGMKIENNRLQAYRGSADVAVGGFCGYTTGGTSPNYRLDYISILGNHILGANTSSNKKISAGGFFGYSNWQNCYIYHAKLTNNLIGYSETTNGAALLTAGSSAMEITLLHTLFHSADGEIAKGTREVKLIQGTNENSNLSAVAMPNVATLRTDTVGKYAARIGNLIGTYGTNAHTYFLAPEISYDSAIATRPVIDVGRSIEVTDAANAKLTDAPYEYRTNIHVIYHEPENAADTDASVWAGAEVKGVADTGNNWKYLFEGISYKKLIENYKNTSSVSDISSYLNAYRLNVTADKEATENVQSVYEKLYRGMDEHGSEVLRSPLKLNDTTYLPAVVVDTQYGTADQLIKGVVAALTGVGGVYNYDNETYTNGMGAITDITTEKMSIVNGKVVSATGNSSLKATKTGSKWTVEYRDYDNDGEDGQPQTFTLLTVKYKWTYTPIDGTAVERREEIRIPVFVMERLIVDTHVKIVEDLVYNADRIKEEGLFSDVVVANDSSFTLYSEYIYGDAREKYAIGIDKRVGMTTPDGLTVKGFASGTKLTLIDICDNNKVYYYTVTEADSDQFIPYTKFTTDGTPSGTTYVNRLINQDSGFELYGETNPFKTTDMEQVGATNVEREFTYSNVAVERFLINVDISGVEENKRIGQELRKFDISPVLSETVAKKTTLTNHTNLQAAIQPGMKIELGEKNQSQNEDKTWIEGNIKASETEGFVNIWATIDISAETEYWRAVSQSGRNTTIDSANNNKYLELQIYLTPKGSDQEIQLPAGTNVTIEGKRTKPEGIMVDGIPDSIASTKLDPVYDTSNIYFYLNGRTKDGTLEFKLNDLNKIIQKEEQEKHTTAGKIRWVDKLTLDFKNADMAPFDQDKYTVHLRLLRMEDKNYPVGGEILDIYERDCLAARKVDLACAVETKDLMQLGINTYQNQTTMPHTIDFDFKLDFSGIMTDVDETDKKMAEKHYTVAYRILEKKLKADGTTEYVPYQGDELSLELLNDPAGKSLRTAVSNNLKFWYVDLSYAKDAFWSEIKSGTKYKIIEDGQEKEKRNKGLLIRNLKLTVKDAAAMDLSNYKVEAIVYVSDAELIPTDIDLDSITTLKDFFVFTVAKLKTDLDY
ncbi:MAG: hypothetical protein PUG54_10210 [Firmicutes bacterium]|nr:hypothetical protein [Bacillota bacterium]